MNCLEQINEMAKSEPEELVAWAEDMYHKQLSQTAKRIFENRDKRIVMLAGPSASGKTTSAKLLSEKLKTLGSKAFIVSLDNFYKDQSQAVLDESGKPDFETVDALDVSLIHACFEEIITFGRSDLPIFDFTKGTRSKEKESVILNSDDVIIVEGIHALNPVITEALPDENLMRLYVSVSSRISDENGEIIFTKRDMRLVRRLVRDFYHRASSVERTFELWQNVLKGEDNYIFPFSHCADIRIDSIHAYEPCVFRSIAQPLLDMVTPDSEYYSDARRLAEKLSLFYSLPSFLIPETSLINEFLE